MSPTTAAGYCLWMRGQLLRALDQFLLKWPHQQPGPERHLYVQLAPQLSLRKVVTWGDPVEGGGSSFCSG